MGTPSTSVKISVQLYTVKDAVEADLDGTVARLAGLGLDTVEAFDFVRRPAELKAAFDAHGISARTGHAFLLSDEITSPDGTAGALPGLEETLEAAATLGLEVVIDPFTPADRWQTRESVTALAERLNRAAAAAEAHGLLVGYHNHDHELRSTIDGVPALEVFAELLDPRVRLEVDLYWATAAGLDAAGLLTRLGERVVAVHVKDGPMREGISTAELPRDQVPAGQGDVPLAAALGAATSAQYAVIEFDHYEGDLFEGVAASRAWLAQHLQGASA
ncbi:sugar phosphate isomerase/epimerase [Quadrisphaera sp. INWT6]|nr:sugar phosphate isomerase/epimerase [Quadrisphaera sp. INWT6]